MGRFADTCRTQQDGAGTTADAGLQAAAAASGSALAPPSGTMTDRAAISYLANGEACLDKEAWCMYWILYVVM